MDERQIIRDAWAKVAGRSFKSPVMRVPYLPPIDYSAPPNGDPAEYEPIETVEFTLERLPAGGGAALCTVLGRFRGVTVKVA